MGTQLYSSYHKTDGILAYVDLAIVSSDITFDSVQSTVSVVVHGGLIGPVFTFGLEQIQYHAYVGVARLDASDIVGALLYQSGVLGNILSVRPTPNHSGLSSSHIDLLEYIFLHGCIQVDQVLVTKQVESHIILLSVDPVSTFSNPITLSFVIRCFQHRTHARIVFKPLPVIMQVIPALGWRLCPRLHQCRSRRQRRRQHRRLHRRLHRRPRVFPGLCEHSERSIEHGVCCHQIRECIIRPVLNKKVNATMVAMRDEVIALLRVETRGKFHQNGLPVFTRLIAREEVFSVEIVFARRVFWVATTSLARGKRVPYPLATHLVLGWVNTAEAAQYCRQLTEMCVAQSVDF